MPVMFAWIVTRTLASYWVTLNLNIFAYLLGAVCFVFRLQPTEVLDSFAERVNTVVKKLADHFNHYNDKLQAQRSPQKKTN
jgi:hypothetical protein